MKASLARSVMALAESCLGDGRRTWASAMRAEFEVAIDNGKPLTFAVGCLTSALREIPMHAEGRFRLTSHLVALGLFPIAALLVVGTTSGFPFLSSGHAGIAGWIGGENEGATLLRPWNSGVMPALALLIGLLILGHILMPWFILERDWGRVAAVARFNGAATVTLFLLTSTLFLDIAFMALPTVGLAIELLAIWLLHRWQSPLSSGAPPGRWIA